MTITTLYATIDYAWDGSTATFPIPFPRISNDHVVVESVVAEVATRLVEDTDYHFIDTLVDGETVEGNNVIMDVTPPTGATLRVRRATPLTQETDYTTGGPFPAESHERGLDKLTMIAQENPGDSGAATAPGAATAIARYVDTYAGGTLEYYGYHRILSNQPSIKIPTVVGHNGDVINMFPEGMNYLSLGTTSFYLAPGETIGAGQGPLGSVSPYVQLVADEANLNWRLLGVTPVKGDQGDSGVGNLWLYGTSDPTTEGVDDDYFLNVGTGDTFYKITGSWVLIGNNIGPIGLTGQGIDHVSKTSGTSAPGTTDIYTVWGDVGETISLGTFSVVHGSDGVGVGDALVANPLSQFAATTSLQLKTVLSDETGSGAAVFATTPTLTTPNITRPIITGTREKYAAIAASNIDLATANVFNKTLTAATTFTVSNVPTTGNVGSFILELTNPSTRVTWWSGIKWAGGTTPVLTTTGIDLLGFYTRDGGATWRGSVLAKDSK